jgi:mgtE-like transporter
VVDDGLDDDAPDAPALVDPAAVDHDRTAVDPVPVGDVDVDDDGFGVDGFDDDDDDDGFAAPVPRRAGRPVPRVRAPRREPRPKVARPTLRRGTGVRIRPGRPSERPDRARKERRRPHAPRRLVGGVRVVARPVRAAARPLRRSVPSLSALAINSSTSLIAGAFLGRITGTLEDLPGLLVLVPAAIGLRGNVFTALGNRLSTAIHTGTFRFSARRDSLLAQNVAASLVLTVGMSLILAVVAKAVGTSIDIGGHISVVDLALVSILGGVLASTVVLAATLVLAAGSVRFGWDLDDVVAPVVSTLGDVITLPALWLAAQLVGVDVVAPVTGWVLVVVAVAALAGGLATRFDALRAIVRESLPVLVVAGCASTLAGVVLENRLTDFTALPALLVLQPAFVSSAGALGGILSSRLSTGLHLGFVEPRPWPSGPARRDGLDVLGLALPTFVFNAVGAHLVARAIGVASPGLSDMVLATLLGGSLSVVFVLVVAYYASIAASRLGVDPDTWGVPIVTSSVDFVGTVALVFALVVLGIT